MNWYKESTSKFDILTRNVSSFFMKKIKKEILTRDEIAQNTGEERAKRIYNKKSYLWPYKQRYVEFMGQKTFLSIELQLLIGEEDHINIGGWFIGLWGNEFRITLRLNIPYYLFNLEDLIAVKEELTVTIRHELEHLKEYREKGRDLEGTLDYDEPVNMDYLFNPTETRATAMSLKMLAQRTKPKNQPPNYEMVVDNYVENYFAGFIEEQHIGTEVETNLKRNYKQELMNIIMSS